MERARFCRMQKTRQKYMPAKTSFCCINFAVVSAKIHSSLSVCPQQSYMCGKKTAGWLGLLLTHQLTDDDQPAIHPSSQRKNFGEATTADLTNALG